MSKETEDPYSHQIDFFRGKGARSLVRQFDLAFLQEWILCPAIVTKDEHEVG